MLFNSQQFLGFFAIVFTVYWLLPWHRARMAWLLIASCVFYMSWNPLLIVLVLCSASVDYFAGLLLAKTEAAARRKLILVCSISCNLGLLGFFKYANFFATNVHSALNLVGIDFQRPVFQIILPLGISFYTFEAISYVVDVYRRKIEPVRNLLDYGTFIMFFPHLVAGPIVRPGDFLPQLQRRKRFDWVRMEVGARLFLRGLFKKAVIADWLATVVDPVFAAPGDFNSLAVWLAVLGYAGQIYGDFSGYSDMAIGLAHLFGFKLKANFNLPYLAGNISEFWQRWHISLSSWLRDYLYIPLGGNRHGELATYRNLMATMLLGGLWHGASWTFLFWGFFHGALLALHRALFGSRPGPTSGPYRWLSVATTFLCVCVGWVFFRAQSFGDACVILQHMAWPLAGASLAAGGTITAVACLGALAIGYGLGATAKVSERLQGLPAPLAGAALAFGLLTTLVLLPEDGRLFIYFQF